MIELYTWPTPNGHKVHIMLEEIGMPYRVHPIDITRGDQFDPEFLAISPNNKMPAIVDPGGPGGAPSSVIQSVATLWSPRGQTRRLAPRAPLGFLTGRASICSLATLTAPGAASRSRAGPAPAASRSRRTSGRRRATCAASTGCTPCSTARCGSRSCFVSRIRSHGCLRNCRVQLM